MSLIFINFNYIETWVDTWICVCTGLFEIPVSSIQISPRDCRLLCELDPIVIGYLKDNMLRDPTSPGATPLALLCIDI